MLSFVICPNLRRLYKCNPTLKSYVRDLCIVAMPTKSLSASAMLCRMLNSSAKPTVDSAFGKKPFTTNFYTVLSYFYFFTLVIKHRRIFGFACRSAHRFANRRNFIGWLIALLGVFLLWRNCGSVATMSNYFLLLRTYACHKMP